MIGIVRGIITLLLLVLFIALTAATWSRRRSAVYDAAARQPLEEADIGTTETTRTTRS